MPFFLDIRTLFWACGTVSFFLAVPMLYTSIRRKTYAGFHLWTAAFVVNGTGMMLLSMRSYLPDLITVIVANTFLIAHLSMIRRGIFHFFGRRSRSATDILPTVLIVLFFLHYTYAKPDVNMRIILISTFLSVLYLQNGVWVFPGHSKKVWGGNRLLSWTFFSAAGWFAMRAFITLFFEGQIADFMTSGTLHGLTVLVYCLTSILIMTGLLTLNSQKMEMELRESEKRYRLLFNQSPIGLIQIDQGGVIMDLNDTFARIMGVAKQQLIGLNTLRLRHPEMAEAIREALRGGQGSYMGEYASAISGKTSFIRVLIRSIQATDGEPMGAIGIFEDITESKKSEQALRDREKMQGVLEMAGAVCHELNQPLMAILGNAELMALSVPQDHPLHDRTLKIIQQIARLKDLNHKLMGIAKYETKSYLKGQIIDIEKASK